jgi:hypothetical protein
MTREVGKRAANRFTGLVDPRRELGVTAPVVAELVGNDGAKFRDAQDAHQRHAEQHDPAPTDAHDATSLADPGVDVLNQVNLFGKRLADRPARWRARRSRS